MIVAIYRNPDCGTSHNVLVVIRNSGDEPRAVVDAAGKRMASPAP